MVAISQSAALGLPPDFPEAFNTFIDNAMGGAVEACIWLNRHRKT